MAYGHGEAKPRRPCPYIAIYVPHRSPVIHVSSVVLNYQVKCTHWLYSFLRYAVTLILQTRIIIFDRGGFLNPHTHRGRYRPFSIGFATSLPVNDMYILQRALTDDISACWQRGILHRGVRGRPRHTDKFAYGHTNIIFLLLPCGRALLWRISASADNSSTMKMLRTKLQLMRSHDREFRNTNHDRLGVLVLLTHSTRHHHRRRRRQPLNTISELWRLLLSDLASWVRVSNIVYEIDCLQDQRFFDDDRPQCLLTCSY